MEYKTIGDLQKAYQTGQISWNDYIGNLQQLLNQGVGSNAG